MMTEGPISTIVTIMMIMNEIAIMMMKSQCIPKNIRIIICLSKMKMKEVGQTAFKIKGPIISSTSHLAHLAHCRIVMHQMGSKEIKMLVILNIK